MGLLGGSPPTAEPRLWEGFFQKLRERGYVEGQNIIFDSRWYGNETERLPALAAELVRLKVDIIVAGASPAPEAAQRATSTIPIVMSYHPDPVGVGLVSNLARPGKNITGMSVSSPELVGKQLQLLGETVPGTPPWPCSQIWLFHPMRLVVARPCSILRCACRCTLPVLSGPS